LIAFLFFNFDVLQDGVDDGGEDDGDEDTEMIDI
jgi:hypothetical protein